MAQQMNYQLKYQIQKLNFFYLIIFIFLSSCQFLPSQSSDSSSEVLGPITVRRKIKDVDYRSSKIDTGFKKRLVILPFLDKEPEKRIESARLNARSAFMNELEKSDQFILLESSELGVDLNSYLKNGVYDLKKLAQDTQKSGIHSVIEGKIIDVRLQKKAEQIGLIRNLDATYEVVVSLRIQNLRSNQEIFNTVKTVTLEEKNTRVAERVSEDQLFLKNPELVEILIKDAFLDFSSQIKEALNEVTWEGRIAAIRGEKIYLNVGRISGVRIGDLLKVVEDGSEIYDSEIGYNLGKIEGRSKGTLEIISYFGQDGAVAIIHSGSGFKESDRVHIYQ